MITEPHAAGSDSYIGEVMRRAVALESNDPAVHAAGVYCKVPFFAILQLLASDRPSLTELGIAGGNPFTDVPELGSQVVITYDAAAGAEAEARVSAAAVTLAQSMWDGREIMQAALISPHEAVEQAKARLGESNPKNLVGNGVISRPFGASSSSIGFWSFGG